MKCRDCDHFESLEPAGEYPDCYHIGVCKKLDGADPDDPMDGLTVSYVECFAKEEKDA